MDNIVYKAVLKSSYSDPSNLRGFLYGFLTGQLLVILIVAGFVRFFLFSNSQRRHKNALEPSSNSLFQNLTNAKDKNTQAAINDKEDSTYNNAFSQSNNASEENSETKPDPDSFSRLITGSLLNQNFGEPESMDWFNVLLAQIINQYRSDARANGCLVNWLNSILNDSKKPDILDDIKITELNIGEDFPIFSNCRIHNGRNEALGSGYSKALKESAALEKNVKGDDQFIAEMDIDLSDTITLGIETRLKMGQPRWFSTIMPVSLTVSIVRFSARMKISVIRDLNKNTNKSSQDNASQDTKNGTEDEKNTKVSLCVSFNPNFTLDIAVKSLLGARSRLQDMPRIEHVIEGLLRKWFTDQFVNPSYKEIVLFKYNTV